MSIEKLRATVSELERELHGLTAVDDEARQVLQEAVREIRAALHEEDRSEARRRSLIQRLQESVGKFEATHPDLTNILSRLIDGLAQMGI
ncbi:MAG: DUF4404 family protein [Deltaproteobacteria bacterium]